MIHIIENFIDESRVKTLLSFCQHFDFADAVGTGSWEKRLIQYGQMSPEIFKEAVNVTLDIKSQIIKSFDLTELYPDCFNLVRWNVGDSMPAHADGDFPGGEFSWRLYGAIVYLHDDYEGGEIVFPNHGLELKPSAGTLVFFPGKLPYLHSVNKVTKGPRFNFASFWTDEKRRSTLDIFK